MDNLAHWQSRNPLPAFTTYSAVESNGDIFVAVGIYGSIVVSPDGLSWTSVVSEESNYLVGLTVIDNSFVAVGRNGTILTSPNGLSWYPVASGTYLK